MDDLNWMPPGYWPDAYTEMMMAESPSSKLFQEFISYAIRAQLDIPDRIIAAADVAGVMRSAAVDVGELADRLHVPEIFVYACGRGWHRLGLRGLALMAEAMDVPLNAFFLDPDLQAHLDVRRYNSYRLTAPQVTIMGGGAHGKFE
jgi:hypothetical protein